MQIKILKKKESLVFKIFFGIMSTALVICDFCVKEKKVLFKIIIIQIL